MAISDQLTLLNNTKQAIKTSINNKGGSVTDSTPFADYSTAIDNLPSGGDNSALIDLIERDITTLNIPSGTTKIGTNAFYKIQSLTSVTIPNSVTIIESSAFEDCVSLTSVTIPNSVTMIYDSCFRGCTRLTSVQLSNSLTIISGYAFYQTGITSIDIPSSVRTIASWAFVYSGLTSVTLHEGLTSIAGFRGTKLTTIKIPSTVTSIESATFYQCRSLTSVVCLPTTPPTLGSSVFDDTNNCPIYVPAESVDAYKAATNWSTYASRIYPITQLATVDGNPVYNYDLGNTNSTTILSTEIDKLPTGTSIEFAEGITNMGGSISGYTTVTLPSTFATFNDQDMIASSVTTLTCLATTPPTAERNNLGGAGLTAIYVPASAVDTYKAASGWSNFASIIEGLPSPTPSVTSITFAQYQEATSPDDRGEFVGCSETVNVDAFEATDSGTFDSDIKAAGKVLVEDNNGNDITSQCTFSSNYYTVWDSTTDPEYDGESEAYYEWRLDTWIDAADAQNPHSATITATYGNLSDDFTIEWTTTSNCQEPEPDPEEPEE